MQSGSQDVEELLVIERLYEKGQRPCFERLGLRLIIVMGSDENNGDGRTPGRKLLLKFDPAQARHTHIKDQAALLLLMG